MTDQSVNFYRRARHLEENRVAYEGMHEELLDAWDQYDDTDPTTKRGALLKARQAIASLQCTEHDSAARMIRDFFRTRKAIDGGWLRDLRQHAKTVSSMAPGNDYAISCLQSIIRGMSSPRLA